MSYLSFVLSALFYLALLRLVVFGLWYIDQHAGSMKLLLGNPLNGISALFVAAGKRPKAPARRKAARQRADRGPGFAMS